jgi:hypothetical protein
MGGVGREGIVLIGALVFAVVFGIRRMHDGTESDVKTGQRILAAVAAVVLLWVALAVIFALTGPQ